MLAIMLNLPMPLENRTNYTEFGIEKKQKLVSNGAERSYSTWKRSVVLARNSEIGILYLCMRGDRDERVIEVYSSLKKKSNYFPQKRTSSLTCCSYS